MKTCIFHHQNGKHGQFAFFPIEIIQNYYIKGKVKKSEKHA